MTDPLELFTDRIRKLREKSELGSIDAAAPKLGVSRGSLGGYERGKRLPDVDFLARLASATGGDLMELIRLRLAAAGHNEAADQVRDEAAPYSAGVRTASECSSHARSALIAEPGFDPAWSLAIMELATRGEITPAGIDRLIEFIREREDDEKAD